MTVRFGGFRWDGAYLSVRRSFEVLLLNDSRCAIPAPTLLSRVVEIADENMTGGRVFVIGLILHRLLTRSKFCSLRTSSYGTLPVCLIDQSRGIVGLEAFLPRSIYM